MNVIPLASAGRWEARGLRRTMPENTTAVVTGAGYGVGLGMVADSKSVPVESVPRLLREPSLS